MNKKTLKTGAFLSLAIAIGALTSCSKKEEAAKQQQQTPAVEVMTVGTSNSDLETSYPAIIRGKTDVQIRPQLSGTIMKVCVDQGQHVRKGQLLFHRHIRIKRRRLRQIADLGARTRRTADMILSINLDRAARSRQITGDDVHRR